MRGIRPAQGFIAWLKPHPSKPRSGLCFHWDGDKSVLTPSSKGSGFLSAVMAAPVEAEQKAGRSASVTPKRPENPGRCMQKNLI